VFLVRDTYCLEIAYDGSSYFGWQSQPHGNTIQDNIETALEKVLITKVRLVPASRTDTGVHAAQQFAIFRIPPGTVVPNGLVLALGKLLPASIKVRCMFKVPTNFHPRQDAKIKVYCYRIFLDDSHNSNLVKAHWRLYKPLDICKLRTDLLTLTGTHDFTSFCASGGNITTCVRTIDSIGVEQNGQSITIRFRGPGFLKQMIRLIIGSAVSANGQTSNWISLKEILDAKNRNAAAQAAPGEGLTLEQILY
jgi:tRNA pseudouridine38-40 synthase